MFFVFKFHIHLPNYRFGRHLKSKHLWFHEKYLQRYGRVENENADLDENSENENLISMQLDESGVRSGENNKSDCENVSFSDFDHLVENCRDVLFR